MKKLLFGLMLPFLLVGCSNPSTNSGDAKSSSGVFSKNIQTDGESFTSWTDESSDINKEGKDMLLEIDNQKNRCDLGK